MRNYLIELATDDIVLVPSEEVNEFIIFCHKKGVYPNGGEIVTDGQFFYI